MTIPKKLRERLDIGPGSVVEFEELPDGTACLVKRGAQRKSVEHATSVGAVRGTATGRLTTQQIMALTRG